MKNLILLLALLPSVAMAQTVIPRTVVIFCSDTHSVINVITGKYAEKTKFVGIGNEDDVVSVWANDDTGTFTIITTLPNGEISCVLSTGDVPKKS